MVKVEKTKKILLSILIALVVIIITAYIFIGGDRKPVIKFHDGQWDSIRISNAVAEFIIKKGYGYPVEMVDTTVLVMLEEIEKGEIDLNMEMWLQSQREWYDRQIEQGNIVGLGMIFEADPQYFIIPAWVAEEYNITTVFDMKDHWKLFEDPEDPTKGLFYNCIIGWRCNGINIVKLEAYGLTRYYNTISPSSREVLDAALERGQMYHQPVFSYYWAPTAIMGAYDWYILEEPLYTDECWEKIKAAVEDESLRPLDEACAYNIVPPLKIAHKDLENKAPDVVEMLKKMNMGLEPLNKALAWSKENDVEDWREAAIYYLQNYEERWRAWVTSGAYENIKEALEEL